VFCARYFLRIEPEEREDEREGAERIDEDVWNEEGEDRKELIDRKEFRKELVLEGILENEFGLRVNLVDDEGIRDRGEPEV